MSEKVKFNRAWKFAFGGTRVVEFVEGEEYDADELGEECLEIARAEGWVDTGKKASKKADG